MMTLTCSFFFSQPILTVTVPKPVQKGFYNLDEIIILVRGELCAMSIYLSPPPAQGRLSPMYVITVD